MQNLVNSSFNTYRVELLKKSCSYVFNKNILVNIKKQFILLIKVSFLKSLIEKNFYAIVCQVHLQMNISRCFICSTFHCIGFPWE